jgi:hypothetical protein
MGRALWPVDCYYRQHMTIGRRPASGWGAAAFALALTCAVPATALASIPRSRPLHLAVADTAETRLQAACADLQAQLQKKTEQISALKQGPRGVREDYELRARMAEANELARRLTALESELHQLRGGAGSKTRAAPAPAAEGAAALEARADVLSDEARKLATRAAGMVRAAGQLRTRQTLRRRAAAFDRDPFTVLDASKRPLITRPGNAPREGAIGRDKSTESAMTGAGAPGGGPMPTNSPQAPPSTLAGPATDSSGGAPTAAPTPMPPTPPVSGPTRAELAAGTLIDPALRAELQRLEAAGAAANDPEALERAAATLANRARTLELEAKTLREKAKSR